MGSARAVPVVLAIAITTAPLLACSRVAGLLGSAGGEDAATAAGSDTMPATGRRAEATATIHGDPRFRARGSARGVAFAAGFLFTQDSEGRLDRWTVPGGEHRGSLDLPCQAGGDGGFAVTPDGKRAAFGCADGVIAVDLSSGKRAFTAAIGKDEYVYDLVASTDGKVFGVQRSDGVTLISARDGAVLWKHDRRVEVLVNAGALWVGVASDELLAFGTDGERWRAGAEEGVSFEEAAFSPEGALAVTESSGGESRLALLDPRSGKRQQTMPVQGGNGLVFPSEDLVWSGTVDGIAFAAPSGDAPAPLRFRRGHSRLVRSADGKWVACAAGAVVQLFDVSKRARAGNGAGLDSGAERLRVSADGKWVLARGYWGDLFRVNLATGAAEAPALPAADDAAILADGRIALVAEEAVVLETEGVPVTLPLGADRTPARIEALPDGRTLVVSYYGEYGLDLALVDAAARTVRSTVDIRCHEMDWMGVDRAGGVLLALCGKLEAFDLATGRTLQSWDYFEEIHGVAEPRPGEHVVYGLQGEDDSKGIFWIPGQRKQTRDGFEPCALSPDGRRLACTEERYDQVTVRAALTNEIAGRLPLAGVAERLVFTPDGKSLVAALENGLLQVLDASALAGPEIPPAPAAVALVAERVRLPDGVPAKKPKARALDVTTALEVRWSPDGRSILVTTPDSLELVEARSGKGRILAYGRSVTGAWSADGTRIAFHDDEQDKLHVIGADGKGKRAFEGVVKEDALAWSSRGVLASGSDEYGKIRLSDASGKEIATLVPPKDKGGWLGGLAFSPDGSRLVSFGDQAATMLWDVARKEGRELVGHTGSIRKAVWSADGRTLATSGFAFDGTVILWAAATLEPIHVLRGLEPDGLAFSPDGKRLAVSSRDELVIWEVASGRPLARYELESFRSGVLDWGKDGTLALVGKSDELQVFRP